MTVESIYMLAPGTSTGETVPTTTTQIELTPDDPIVTDVQLGDGIEGLVKQ